MVTQRIRSWRTPLAAVMLTAMLFGASGSAALATTAPQSPVSANQAQGSASPPQTSALCGATAPGYAHCMSLRRIDIGARSNAAVSPLTPPSGYGPANLVSAYGLPGSSSGVGAGETVAIVDAYDLSTAESDLATYRSQFGLSACTTANGCFKKIDQNGGTNYPAVNNGWDGEIALDIDMVSAICPSCNILLVEAASNSYANLATAVNTAASLGAVAISNSYGGGEFAGETSFDANYDHPGIAVTASSGDGGYGVEYPAAAPHVVAVGGTSLAHAANARGWSETVWSGAGSGCSSQESKPSWQTDSGCATRTVADVSAIADPNTGVAVYSVSQGGWVVFGGTSVASPIIASTFALAGKPAANTYPVTYLYAHANLLNDVTGGSNGSCGGTYLCTGVVGYDGPTGLGTPNGTGAFVPSGKPVPTLTYTGSTSAATSAAITLSATLTSSSVGISGRTISFVLNGVTKTATTNGSGVASVGSTAPATGGGYPIAVTFAGDGTYAAASTSATLTVTAAKKASTLRYTGNLQVRHGTSLVLKARLTASTGVRISGDTVTFVFNGVTLTAITDGTGLASVTVTAPARGTYTVTASFAGDATYAPASTSASINVT